MKTKAKLQQKGNNLLVYIPAHYAKELHLSKGEEVSVELQDMKIIIEKEHELTIGDLLADLPSDYAERTAHLALSEEEIVEAWGQL